VKTVIDEMQIEVDQEQCAAYVAGIQAAVFNEDDPGLFQLTDELDADMKIAVWSKLDSKDRAKIKKLSAARKSTES